LDFNALHRVGGAMEAVLAEMAPFIMIDHHQNRMIMQHTYSDTSFGPPAKCYTISSLFLIKRHRQDNWNLHLYRDTN
jgi:phosphoesterase RecJ-like protein